MSAAAAPSISTGGKKAVHVKWAGKTIALGTFPATEADEKCAKAKALTRAWRSTMRPKPTREWVMLELEKLGVRVVSGRLGRKAGEDDDQDDDGINIPNKPGDTAGSGGRGISTSMEGLSGENPAENYSAELDRFMARRNSSLGFLDTRRNSLGSLGGLMGFDSTDQSVLGLGIGADPPRRSSSLGLGSLAGGGLGNIGMSVNPNQHYEMLKLHHMNLLNEIQETTLMMNLYQQQQLQQQQQQLAQQANAEGLGAERFDRMMNGNPHQHRTSLGLGDFSTPQLMMSQHMMANNPGGGGAGVGQGANKSAAATTTTKSKAKKADTAKADKKKPTKSVPTVSKSKSKASKAKSSEEKDAGAEGTGESASKAKPAEGNAETSV